MNYNIHNRLSQVSPLKLKPRKDFTVTSIQQHTYFYIRTSWLTEESSLYPFWSLINSVWGGLKGHQQPAPPPSSVTCNLQAEASKCPVIEWWADKESSWTDLLVWGGRATGGPMNIRVIWLLSLDWQRNVRSNKRHFIEVLTIKREDSDEVKWT